MSKVARKTNLLFGSSAGINQIAQFGSLAAGSSAFTTDPAVIQSLSNYLAGWFNAIVGPNSPAIEDMNALCYLFSYQLSYMLQTGVPEWDSGTTYYQGSFVSDTGGAGLIYVSLTNANLNNAVSSATNWQLVGGKIMSALGDIVYAGSNAAATRLAGNTSSTPTILTQTGTGSASAPPAWRPFIAPTVQKFTTSGAGTYTLPSSPAAPLYIRVRMVGGGGGGGGGGSASATSGAAGGNTTFGTSLLIAYGGAGGGAVGGSAGAGGAASLGSGPIGVALSGGGGGAGGVIGSSVGSSVSLFGGVGGSSAFGGGGPSTNGIGGSGAANTGGGGAGGLNPGSSSATTFIGAGGGAGGFVDAIIPSPASSYSLNVGAAGTAGSGAGVGYNGGAGGNGIVIVDEFYQ